MAQEDIVVVGAGPAGLAVSACLRQRGLAHTLLERDTEVAGSWRRHYDRLHLHTAKQYSALPGQGWPRDAPRYPSRTEVVDYLERYASRHATAPRLGVQVHRLARAGDGFTLDTSAGTLSPRCVVVATGGNAQPQVPQFVGLSTFCGSVVHAQAYKNPTPYLGQRTLVVGCGNSGAEIALDLAEHGVDVSLVVRGPVHVVPRELLGRPTQETSVLMAALPLGLRDTIVNAVMRVAVGDLSHWGIQRPSVGLNRMMEESARVPILDIGTIAQIKAGKIRVRPAVQEVLVDQVRFAGGERVPFEAIVLATGYTSGLSQLVDGFDEICDARGRPPRVGHPVPVPGLHFVGFRIPPTGALREISIEAPRVAAAIAERMAA